MSKYGTDEDFEQIAAALAASNPKFWQRIGQHVEPDLLENAGAQTIFKLCREIANEHQPTPELIKQRAAFLVEDGKLTTDNLALVKGTLELAKETWDVEAIISELVGPVRQAKYRAIAKRITSTGVSAHEPKFDQFIDDMLLCDKLGTDEIVQDKPASEFGIDTEELLASAPSYIQMPTGIGELDILLRGGPGMGSLVTVLMDSKAGKSMTLNHFSSVAALHGENVGILSLEGEEHDQHRRLLAAISGVPINDFVDEHARRQANDIVRKLYKQNKLGKIVIGSFQPKTLNERDVLAWFDRQEKEKGIRLRYRVIDYGDLIVSSKREDRESEYRTGFTVWSALKAMSQGDGKPNWVITASQAKRPDWKPGQVIPILNRSGTGDSRHKYQLSDLFLTGTPQPDISARNGYIWLVDADRHFGATGQATDVVPHFRHMGRMADISHLGL